MTPSLNNTYCPLPFSQVVLKDWKKGQGAQNAHPCCNMIRPDSLDPMKLEGKVAGLSVIEIFNSDSFNQLRSDLLNNINASACDTCWTAEKLTGTSARIASSVYANVLDVDPLLPKLQMLDIKFGENCNLRCRMCSPGSSNKLRIDIKYFLKTHNRAMLVDNPAGSFSSKRHLTLSEHDVDCWDTGSITAMSLLTPDTLKNIAYIRTAGGEPFLSPDFIDFLKKLIDNGTASSVTLEITTNATKITEYQISLLAQFKHVNFILSIDGTYRIYEYIRYPMIWESVVATISNLRQQLPNSTMHASAAISVYNAHNVIDLLDWCTANNLQLSVNVVHPHNGRLDIAVFPEYIKQALLAQWETICDNAEITKLINYLRSSKNTRAVADTKHEIVSFDSSRNQSYSAYLDKTVVDWLNSI